LDWFGRFLALENAAGIDADLPIPGQFARAIAHESADFDKFAQKVYGRQQMTRRQRDELHATIDEKRVGTNNKRIRRILHERGKGRFDLTIGAGPENVDVQPGDRRCRFHVLDHTLGRNRIGRIDKERDTCGARRHLMQQAQPLGVQFCRHVVDAGDIAARAAEACHDTGLYRVGAGGKDDRNGSGRRLCHKRRHRAYRRDNDRHLTPHQIGRQFREPAVVAVPPAIFDRNIAALDIAGFSEPFTEAGDESCVCFGRARMEQSYHRHCGLLRPRRERPRRRRAADQRDKIAPLQSIELHLVPQPAPGQHIALVRSSQGLAALRKFNPANVSNGSFASKAAEAVRPCTSAAPPKADVNSPPWLPPLSAMKRREQVQQ
jgi:hypothetical protein